MLDILLLNDKVYLGKTVNVFFFKKVLFLRFGRTNEISALILKYAQMVRKREIHNKAR